jgi:hypothetical protein
MRNTQTIAVMITGLAIATLSMSSPGYAQLQRTFPLRPNPAMLNCLRLDSKTPTAKVTVGQGDLTDDLTITGGGIKPGLAFDLFTVQKSSLLANGMVDPNFTNFGLAWYQTDLQASPKGQIFGTLHTILINQIFGFDPGVSLPPTNTFHVGFWFNDPADATACGFTGFTPFNGEHHAGPLAMISLPNATTNLGPLCLSPNTSTIPATCNP